MPEFVNSFELNYQKRFGASFISLESYFRETQNAITRTQGIYSEQDNIMLLEYKNVNTERAIGAEVMANWEVTDWLRLNPSVNMYQYEVQGTLQNDSALNRDSNLTDVSVARSSFNYDLRLNGTAKITPTTRLQLIGMYNGPSATAQGNREGFYMVNAAVRQDFFDGKLSATFQAQNIFDSMRFKINSEGSNFQSLYMFVREARIFQLTLSWKINNYKSKEKGGYRDGGGMDFGGDDF
jgi:outer membrane receptor protein involved in Fe transport